MHPKNKYAIFVMLFYLGILFGAPQQYNKNDSEDKRMQAIFDTDDQKVLSEIALYDPSAPIRRTAATKLSDPELLAQIAENDVDEKVRGTAHARLDKIMTGQIVFHIRRDIFEASTKEILLLPPKVRYICIKTDTLLNVDQTVIQELQNVMNEKSFEQLTQKGFKIQTLDSRNIDINSALLELNSNTQRLFYSRLEEDLAESLKSIEKSNPNVNVLAIELKVKVGASGSWNPMSGAIALNNSYSVVRAVLLNSADAQPLWKNQSLFRKVPGDEKATTDESYGATSSEAVQRKSQNIKSTALEETLNNIFTNLTFKEKNENE